MLGCQDFCGYYDWSFHYVRRRWGNGEVERLWREAIGGDSQKHYSEPAAESGLLALYKTWVNTGEDEHCDWTFTLDEEKNVLRWDMRECPSKGFLIQNDRNADEDYCNHCMGWIIPMLQSIGAEMVAHEHNHCGQCWAEMRMKDRPSQPLDLPIDIRKDPRWNRGYLDRWTNDQPQPHDASLDDSSDPCAALEAWQKATAALNSPIVTDSEYNDLAHCRPNPRAVLIGCPPQDLNATATRYLATPPAARPLLLHAYLPATPFLDFVTAGLPRPFPILPLLIRKRQYTHTPHGPHPTTEEFLALLQAALGIL
jgi:hypothetical protein